MRVSLQLTAALPLAHVWLVRTLAALPPLPALPALSGGLSVTMLPPPPAGPAACWVIATGAQGVLGTVEVWPGAHGVYRVVLRPGVDGQPDPAPPDPELLAASAVGRMALDAAADRSGPAAEAWAAFLTGFLIALPRASTPADAAASPFMQAQPATRLQMELAATPPRPRTRGATADTRGKLRELYRLREAALTSNRPIPDFTKACIIAGISWETARRYIPPELRQQWRSRVHWSLKKYSELSESSDV